MTGTDALSKAACLLCGAEGVDDPGRHEPGCPRYVAPPTVCGVPPAREGAVVAVGAVYLLHRVDRSSLGGGGRVVGVAVSRADAEAWVADEPAGSWYERYFFPAPLMQAVPAAMAGCAADGHAALQCREYDALDERTREALRTLARHITDNPGLSIEDEAIYD